MFEVDLQQDDYPNLPEDRVDELVTKLSFGGHKMKLTDRIRGGGGRCVALVGAVGESVSCSIYDSRPAVCREFGEDEDWFGECQRALRRARTRRLPTCLA